MNITPEAHRVTRERIGAMAPVAETALANAILARQMRHAARCNCGRGRARAGCTIMHPCVNQPGVRKTIRSILLTSERARDRMNAYRRNRTWTFSGATPRE